MSQQPLHTILTGAAPPLSVDCASDKISTWLSESTMSTTEQPSSLHVQLFNSLGFGGYESWFGVGLSESLLRSSARISSCCVAIRSSRADISSTRGFRV